MLPPEKMYPGLRMLFANFAAEADEDQIRCYVLGLADLGEEAFNSAILRAIRELKFLPKVAELRELAGEKRDGESRAIAAWSDVLQAVRLGPYKHVSFEDRLCNAAIRNLGGWPKFHERYCNDEKWVRLDFIKTYKSFVSSGVNGEVCQPLPGLSEVESVGGVVREPVPRLIACDEDRIELPCRLLAGSTKSLLSNVFKIAGPLANSQSISCQ